MGYVGRTDLELTSAVSQQDRDGDLVINQVIEVDKESATCYTAAVHCQQRISTRCSRKKRCCGEVQPDGQSFIIVTGKQHHLLLPH